MNHVSSPTMRLSASTSTSTLPPPHTPAAMTAAPHPAPGLTPTTAVKNSPPKSTKYFLYSLTSRAGSHRWVFFTLPMATGSLANILNNLLLPFPHDWLRILGTIVFVIGLLFFLVNTIFLGLRFAKFPGDFRASIEGREESLYIPCFVVSMQLIYIGACRFVLPYVPILLRFFEVLFYISLPVTPLITATHYLFLWSTLTFPLHLMTPLWIFPAYPLLLSLPLLTALLRLSTALSRPLLISPLTLMLLSFCLQSVGLILYLLISSTFLTRLMSSKLPPDTVRPSIFISIGPPSFTAVALLSLHPHLPLLLPPEILAHKPSAYIVSIFLVLPALMLISFAFFFLMVSLGSLLKYTRSKFPMPTFQMAWWSFIFPNTALVVAGTLLGEIFDSRGVRWVAVAGAIGVVVGWIAVGVAMVKSLVRGDLLRVRVRGALMQSV